MWRLFILLFYFIRCSFLFTSIIILFPRPKNIPVSLNYFPRSYLNLSHLHIAFLLVHVDLAGRKSERWYCLSREVIGLRPWLRWCIKGG